MRKYIGLVLMCGGIVLVFSDLVVLGNLLRGKLETISTASFAAIAVLAFILNIIQMCIFAYVIFVWGLNSEGKTFADKVLKYFGRETSLKNNQSVLDEPKYYTNEELAREMLKTQAQLTSLQTQINPHFLYNTLETIRGKAISHNEEEIASMIETLARLFQYNIRMNDELATLAEEFESVKYFVQIQNYRFRNKFVFILDMDDVEEMAENYVLPALSLQPIVENAIHHGLEKKIGKGTIEIKCFTTENTLIIDIIDDGVGMEERLVNDINMKLNYFDKIPQRDRNKKKGSGIALINVQQRIKLLFGEEYGIHLISTENVGTQVEIVLPKESRGKENENRDTAFKKLNKKN